MNFIYADDLKKSFDVFGHFYELEIGRSKFNCRSLLEIKIKDFDSKFDKKTDAIVIMMNPGSSRPIDVKYRGASLVKSALFSSRLVKDVIPTYPDNAQYQIMRVMKKQKWRYVRILNLSDLRNGNSDDFSLDFTKASEVDESHPHSIIHPGREHEFDKYVYDENNGPVIAAWGNIKILHPFAKNALIKLKHKSVVGVKDNNCPYVFKYASPYRKSHKLNWLVEVESELTKYYNVINATGK